MRHDVIDPLTRKHRAAPDRPMNFIIEAKQIFGEVRSVLPADARDECLFQNDVFLSVINFGSGNKRIFSEPHFAFARSAIICGLGWKQHRLRHRIHIRSRIRNHSRTGAA